MDLKKLSPAERIIGAAGLLLLVDLLFLPWHRVSFGFGDFRVTSSRSGVESPNGFWGLLALLLVLALVTHIVLSEFTTVKLPTLPVSWGQADFYAGIAIAVLLLLKLVLETSALAFGAWLAVICAGALVYGGYQRYREVQGSGGLTA
ncbi:MAG TPA: hypothetical protein VI854_01600 [Acidimicrobiia bacterium]|nr:hypothetical protein [Acidimicrobiia bacterium]